MIELSAVAARSCEQVHEISKKGTLYLNASTQAKADIVERSQEPLHQIPIALDSTFTWLLQQRHRPVHLTSSGFLINTDVKNFLLPDHCVEVFDHVNVALTLIHAPLDPLPLQVSQQVRHVSGQMNHHVPVSQVLPDQTTGTFDSGAVFWSEQAGSDVNTTRLDRVPEAGVQIGGCPVLRMTPLRRVEIGGRSRLTQSVAALAIVERS